MSVIVCSSPYVRTVTWCPTCKRRRRMAGVFGLYYGPTLTCLACGDTFTEEGRSHRPFARYWRRDSIARARRIWKLAAPLREEEARQLRDER